MGRRRKRGKKPGKAEAWESFAASREGRVVRNKRDKPARIDLPHEEWTLSLDTYVVSTGNSSQTFTRVRCPYAAASDFRCKVRKSHPFAFIGRLFGLRDLSMGRGEFDRRFLVYSDSEGQARSFLLGTRVEQLLLMEPKIRLDVKPLERKHRKRVGDGIRQVVVWTGGDVREGEKLAHMVDLCAAVVDQLARLGVAAEEPVELEW